MHWNFRLSRLFFCVIMNVIALILRSSSLIENVIWYFFDNDVKTWTGGTGIPSIRARARLESYFQNPSKIFDDWLVHSALRIYNKRLWNLNLTVIRKAIRNRKSEIFLIVLDNIQALLFSSALVLLSNQHDPGQIGQQQLKNSQLRAKTNK